ncbi:DeoR family transcriptional regulator [Sneathiella sp. P13V-1]|uniref:DeoR/GlpR family DNA-binding transcription regulator n=1 Tax=Sneathiella sp. P13V-1 TaxID=2697366 RepID=UPI00187BA73A|nr:DeoR/GlpR family DNA-binding transcription regulator [Sneathiella sp. P13V-1]MBE7636641.1 DeoR family transcriptional regulator [Sneathiella sp. P13V-1]
MKPEARKAEIADLVRREGFISVEALADKFAVTTQTIRKDINQLHEAGLVFRRHGGVEPITVMANLAYGVRQVLNLDFKRKLASLAAEYIEDGSVLAFSIGTTPELVAQSLAAKEDLTVITNNLGVGMSCLGFKGCRVFIAGGEIRTSDRDIVGPEAANFFGKYKVDIGIFGIGGLDPEGHLLDFHEEEVMARNSILENCRTSFLVMDHTKVNRPAHVRGGHITDVDYVFCDRALPANISRMLEEANTKVIYPKESEKV